MKGVYRVYRTRELRRLKGSGAAIPARRWDWGLGRERVYLLVIISIWISMGEGRGWNVLGKSPGKSLFAADFLAADEGVDGDSDGAVDVLCGAVL